MQNKSSEMQRQQRISELIRSHNQKRNEIRALQEHVEQDHELLKRIWELLEYWETAPVFYRDNARSLRACFEFQEAEYSTEEEGDKKLTENCSATSWKGKSHRPYGPGSRNRCVRTGYHVLHEDGFGNVFTVDKGKCLVIGRKGWPGSGSTEEEGDKKNG